MSTVMSVHHPSPTLWGNIIKQEVHDKKYMQVRKFDVLIDLRCDVCLQEKILAP